MLTGIMYLVRLHLLRSRKGQGMVEYGLILGLVTVVAITALTSIGSSVSGYFGTIVTDLKAAT